MEVCVALVSSKHSWANADLNVAMAGESQGNRKIQENLSLFTGVSNIHFFHIVPSINLTASEAICEAPFCTVHEKGGLPQIQPKLSLQAKNVPWPENGASAVVEGRRPGRDWCRWRTVPGTSTLAPAHTGSALCPLCARRLGVRPIHRQPCLGHSCLQQQRGPTRPSGSLYHYSAHRPFTPSTPGQPLTSSEF